MKTVTLEIQEMIMSGNVAYVWSLNYGTLKFEGGDENSVDSKSLMVLQKTTDGWKTHRYMFNTNTAPD